MFTPDVVIRSLPHLLMVALCAEIPKRHITCTGGSYFKGTAASVTCNFRKDMNSDRRTINVVRYPEGTTTDDPGKDVLLCQWQNNEEEYKCELDKGFSIDGNITDHLRLKLPADTGNFTGLYSCFIMHAIETLPNACELTVKEEGGIPTTLATHGTHFQEEKGESSLLWLIVLPVVLIGVLGVASVYTYRRASLRCFGLNKIVFRKYRVACICDIISYRTEVRQAVSAKSSGSFSVPKKASSIKLQATMGRYQRACIDEKSTCTEFQMDHLIQCESNVVFICGLKDLDLSKGSLEGLMKRFDQEMTASLRKDTGAIDMTCTVPIKTLPNESANGAFLVVEFTSTTIQVHLVRLQHLKSRGMSTKCAGSLSETHDIPSMTKLGQGRELFDFIAKKVNDFVNAQKLMRKKFRLVFVVSFPCVFSPDFANAYLTKWTRGFRCDGVVDRNMKELLQEALERNGVPNTIRVTTATNDTVGVLMSVAYKDPSCRIALSLMDGFRACYIPAQDNQATSHGDNHTHTNLITTHLGALGENDSVGNFITECDRRLDQYTVHCGKQRMEKMTSVLYFGELVRLELVQQMENGRLFETSPHSLSKLRDKNVVSADDVSLIESDTDTYFITKHVLKKLNVTYTEEDCEAVRLVCKTVTNRAADLAAAGLAMVIHRLNQPEVSVAIETLLHQYHPGFLNRLNERTKELVEPQLKFKLVPSQEGSSKGAALLTAAVSPSFPKSAPTTPAFSQSAEHTPSKFKVNVANT
ncbi:hexokinase-like [Littorina saxatilis]|uniref:hexokinase-like n=1 Tax=Littorina saxatilis TaxID=31220 RepID=UPI0038B46804